MGSSRFDFIRYEYNLYKACTDAEKLMKDFPPASLNRSRVAAEILLELIYKDFNEECFYEDLHYIESLQLISSEQARLFRFIRSNGSSGSHNVNADNAAAVTAVEYLETLCRWYVARYSHNTNVNNNFTSSSVTTSLANNEALIKAKQRAESKEKELLEQKHEEQQRYNREKQSLQEKQKAYCEKCTHYCSADDTCSLYVVFHFNASNNSCPSFEEPVSTFPTNKCINCRYLTIYNKNSFCSRYNQYAIYIYKTAIFCNGYEDKPVAVTVTKTENKSDSSTSQYRQKYNKLTGERIIYTDEDAYQENTFDTKICLSCRYLNGNECRNFSKLAKYIYKTDSFCAGYASNNNTVSAAVKKQTYSISCCMACAHFYGQSNFCKHYDTSAVYVKKTEAYCVSYAERKPVKHRVKHKVYPSSSANDSDSNESLFYIVVGIFAIIIIGFLPPKLILLLFFIALIYHLFKSK